MENCSYMAGSWQEVDRDEGEGTAKEAISQRAGACQRHERHERQAHEALTALERWIEELRDAPQGGMRDSVERQVRCRGTQHDHALLPCY